MPAPKVTSTVDDQSTRVVSTSSYNTAIVIDAKKGPIDTPVKVTGQTDFLRKFTPNERYELGWDLGILEAYRYLEEEGGLYVVRCAHITDETDTDEIEDVRAAGCKFATINSDASNVTFKDTETYKKGLTYEQFKSLDTDGYWDSSETDACIIYAASCGVYGDNITVEIITDESQVKLPGAFIIQVFLNNVFKERFTCSLDPKLKSGYGVNCSIDKVLQNSTYIRGAANTILDNLIDKSYEVEIKYGNRTSYGYVKEAGNEGDVVSIDNVYINKYCLTKYTQVSGRIYTCKYTGNITQFYTLPKPGNVKLSGGNDGSVATTGDRIRALKTLGNMNDVDFQLVLDGGQYVEEYQSAIKDLCTKRKESCHGIICTPYEDEVSADSTNDLVNYRKYQLNLNSYSLEMYSPHQKYYDEFNDRYVWLSPGPYVAALIMRTARERGWHWAVAGYNRGVVPSLDVARAFDETDMDTLSDCQINSIKKEPGAGNVIWDELTLWDIAQDLQDAHISRWVNIYVRPALEKMLQSFLFEFNDDETRGLVVKKIETFMDPQKAARACYAYRVLCSEENNTPDDIENNRLNVWLYIKPQKLAKWITQKIILSPFSTRLEDLEV